MEAMSLLGFSVCAVGAAFGERLPFPVAGIDRDAVPSALRRRTSQATQLAFSAATRACAHAHRSPGELPAVFATVGGEIQVTDRLCIELAKSDGVISPTAFHNSVHNTAAGYWTIVHHCRRAACALAAGRETFAMALLETWCQLACQGGELLLVCYDEQWPSYLAPPLGDTAFASALVLGAGAVCGALAHIGASRAAGCVNMPAEWAEFVESTPAAAAIPLLDAVARPGKTDDVPISASGWVVNLL
jgi:hypothetical protein